MFSLKISAVLNRIKKVKVRVGVSSSKDVSLDEENALFDEGGRRNLADENPISESNAGIISKSEAIKKLYKLEMDEKGRTLSFKWVLNSEKSTRRKPIEPPPFKRARTSNLSSSIANYEPPLHRGGAQLKFISDPTRGSTGVPRKVEDLSINLPGLPSLKRIYELNENEEEEEDTWLSSTSKPPVSYKIQSRKKSTVVYEGGRNAVEKTKVHSSKVGGSLRDDIVAHGSHEKVMIENCKKVPSIELIVHKNDSSIIKREPQPQIYTNFVSDAVLLLPEPNDGGLARESQGIPPQKRRKRKGDNTENRKTSDMKPKIFKAVKAEVNLEKEEILNFPLFIPGNDGIQAESKGLLLIRNPNSTVDPGSEHSAGDKESPSRFLNLVHKRLSEDVDEERGDFCNVSKVASYERESETGASRADANVSVQLLASETQDYGKKAGVVNLDTCDLDLTMLQDNVENQFEARLPCKEEMNCELCLEAPVPDDGLLLRSPSPDAVNGRQGETDPPTHGSNEEGQVAVVGVTEDELIEALLARGLSMKIDELVLKFGDRLDTTEAQNAFLKLLKRHCMPEMKEDEMYLVLRRR